MKGIQTLFWGGVVAAVLLIGGLLTIYFFQFHGPLADNSSQWADFSSFVGNLSMVFLTALNTIVVYKLTYTIARREEIEHKFEVQRELNKSFTSSVYSVFVSIDDDNGACGLADNKLAFAWDNFRLLQTFENINPIFGSSEYKQFMEDYKELLLDYKDGETYSNTNIDQKAYQVLSSARKLRVDLYKALTNTNNQ